ncbi:AlbA family DNA-binding domain-containing protein [Xanthomonas campestris]|uniref:AlbA family DNA-binding domain-containing protein n=1 Tax=Xanthomonas campestris TaxID=339 RepID=UPI003555EB84
MTINSEWIEQLVKDQAQESLHLDFKRELPTKREDSRKELLKDVCALANTEGGRIVYGVQEGSDGLAEAIVPITGEDQDDAQRRVDQCIADGIEPRVVGYTVSAILVNGGYVLVIEVPQQYGGPFQTNFNNQRRFVYRQGTMNLEMNYGQLRAAFQLRGRASQAATEWRIGRLAHLDRSIKKRQLEDVAWLALHIVPHQSLFSTSQIDIHAIRNRCRSLIEGDYTLSSTFTADGLLYTNAGRDDPKSKFIRVFRSGLVEVVWKGRERQQPGKLVIHGYTATSLMRNASKNCAIALGQVGVSGPAYIALSGVNAEGYGLLYPGPDFQQEAGAPWEPAIELPMLEVDSLAQLATDPDASCRQLADMLFQTFGLEDCPFYSVDGEWISQP